MIRPSFRDYRGVLKPLGLGTRVIGVLMVVYGCGGEIYGRLFSSGQITFGGLTLAFGGIAAFAIGWWMVLYGDRHPWQGTLRDYRGVFRYVGDAVVALGVAMIVCALVAGFFNQIAGPVDKLSQRGGVLRLALSGAPVALVGLAVRLYFGRYASDVLNRREAPLAVVLIWFAAGVAGAVPFVSCAGMSFTNAFFESISGLTTTGATVITNIEGTLTRPMLLWRSLIQWFGGMGIVVLFVAFFPNLGVGGKHMFGEEVPGTTAEGLKPRIAETSSILWKLYFLFTAIEGVLLFALGMDPFEALCHAFTTMSTGGFSTRDSSAGAFNSSIQILIAVFMLIGSVNYNLYYLAIRDLRNNRATRGALGFLRGFLRSLEFKAYLVIVIGVTGLLTVGLLDRQGRGLFIAFRDALFTVGTTVSSTGYGSHDLMREYPQPLLFVVILLMFIGGCAGSTAGGIKVERIVLLLKVSWAQICRSFRPNLVQVIRMGRTVVRESAINDAVVFFIIYMFCMVFGIALVSVVDGASVERSFGAVLTCLSNMGPAPFYFSDQAGVSDNFAGYSAVSKYFFTVAMVMGRLEFFTLLALLMPGFWRR